METEELKVGMKVQAIPDAEKLYWKSHIKYIGKTMTIDWISPMGNIRVKENDELWQPDQLVPIVEKKKATELGNKFVVKFKTVEEGVEVLKMFKYSTFNDLTENDLTEIVKSFIEFYSSGERESIKTVAISIANNSFKDWANVDYYKRHESEFGKIYTLAEIKAYIKRKQETKEEEMEVETNNILAKKEYKMILFNEKEKLYRTTDEILVLIDKLISDGVINQDYTIIENSEIFDLM